MKTFPNLLEDSSRAVKTPEPCILVIFGATGDLTSRKLVPALYNLVKDGQLPHHFVCIGFARREKTDEQFRNELYTALQKYSRTKPIDQSLWNQFKEKIFYHRSEFHQDEGYEELKTLLSRFDAKFGTRGNRVYYLSTQPSFFPLIIEKLGKHGLIYNVNEVKDKWSRVIIEKPFGEDLQSALTLQKEITNYLDESQIYRIDHYLGKETVQNLLVLRFANSFFESIWNNQHVDHIQITVAEDQGIGTRGRFFEEAGILRDIVQNHLMQLFTLVAMEPPVNMNADSIRDEKVKVLEAIRPLQPAEFDQFVVRGQYGNGFINGEPVKAYREEENVDPKSNIETFMAMKLYVDNWRWSEVPFLLRAGKRLPKRATEIAIIFKKTPGILFTSNGKKPEENVLVIRIQPDEGISLKMNCKVPGLNSTIQPVKMDFRYGSFFGATPPEAYERLICDCMSGDGTLFARNDEVTGSWKFLTPILEAWKAKGGPTIYSAGTWGPKEAEGLLGNPEREWRLI